MQSGEAENGSCKAVIFSSLKPQLWIPAPKAADAVQFYKVAFGAEELKRAVHPKRKADQELPLILCADLKLGSSVFAVCDQTDETVKSSAGTFSFYLETDDVEAAVKKAVNAGAVVDGGAAEEESAPGVASEAKLKDPYGYVWAICAPSCKDDAADASA